MLTGHGHADQHAVPPGEGRRRHRRDHRASASTSCVERRRGDGAGRRACSTRDFIEQHTHGFEAFAAIVRGHDWERDRARVGPDARTTSRRPRQVYVERRARHRHLRHGPDPARARRRERRRCSSTCCCCGQYRPRRRRHLPGARPFQRAGPAHGRHHARSRSWCRSTSWRSCTASSRRATRA